MGFCTCCCKCVCKIIKFLCGYVCEGLVQYTAFGCCCCLFGMATMAFIFLLYYGVFSPKLQTAALNPVVMYDYEGVPINTHEDIKRHILNTKREYEDSDSADDNYISDEEVNDALRDKRASSQTNAAATPVSQGQSSSTVAGDQTSSTAGGSTSASKKASKTRKTTCPPTITPAPPEDGPDFQMGHRLMDAVFGDAEKSDMKQSLGLCRKNADLKIPELKASLFPSSEAVDILNCINDILRNTATREICLHLDEEMNAYLRWLILTGESKEKHKPQVSTNTKEDFLFPTGCPAEHHEDGAGSRSTPTNLGGEPGRANYPKKRGEQDLI